MRVGSAVAVAPLQGGMDLERLPRILPLLAGKAAEGTAQSHLL